MKDSGGTGRSGFAYDTALLIVANGFTGLLFMLVHVVLGRLMDSLDYAVLVSLLGMLNILNVPSNAIRVVLARYVAEYAHGRALELWVTLVKRAFQKLTLWGILALAGWGILSFYLPAFFDGYTPASLAMVGLVAFISLFNPVVSGTLQGARYFGWMAGSGLASAGARLLLALAVVLLGGGVTSVMGAVAVASLLGLGIGYLPFHRLFVRTPALDEFQSGPMYRYFWPVLVGQGGLFLLLNADLILSVRFLDGPVLEAYGKAAMLSRTALFLPLPVAIAMFPRAVNSPRRILLWGPVGFTLAVSVAAAGAIAWMPGLPMKLMYGISDPLHNELLRSYVWAVVPLSVAMVLSQYLWARHETNAMLWAALVVAAYIAALWFFHESPAQIIRCLGGGGTLVALWLVVAAARAGGRVPNPRDGAGSEGS